jgi:hypothetical protein
MRDDNSQQEFEDDQEEEFYVRNQKILKEFVELGKVFDQEQLLIKRWLNERVL